jgi:hypothetical protein
VHVVIPISADALRNIFEANGWQCVEEHEFFFAMQKTGSKDEPSFIPRIGSLVPVETMEQATHRLGLKEIIAGLTPEVIADTERRMAALDD